MLPVVFGIAAAITALLATSCGSNDETNLGTPRDAGKGGSSGTGGTSGTGVGGASGTGGNAGRGGSSGTSGSGGSGGLDGSGGAAGDAGMGGIGDGGMDSGGMGGAAGEGGAPSDAGTPVSVPYHFGMVYGSPLVPLRGTGTLLFSNLDSCKLLGGSFNAEYPSTAGKNPFSFSINLAGNQSVNFCSGEVTLPLDGGIFDGVSWMLTNHSVPLSSKQSWEIAACMPETDGGVENCSGALNITNP